MKKIKLYINKIIKLYKSGLSAVQIAKEMKVSPNTILRRLHKIGIKPKNGGYYSGGQFKKGNIPWKKGIDNRITKICKVCKKKFKIYPYREETAKYCSRKCHGRSLMGKKLSKETRKKLRKSTKGLWQDKEYREKTTMAIIKGKLKRPTSLEKEMIDIIKKYNLPYKYVGDGSFLIGWKNPDFVNINGEKKLIEVGNVYHHQGNYIEERSSHFAKYGWKSHIFIANKLNENEIVKALTENRETRNNYS